MEQKEFGKFISNRRKELGISQKDLADFLNVSIPTVSKWESGLHLPDLSLMGQLAKILQVDLMSLVACENQINNNYDLENSFDITNFSKYFSYLRKINNYSLMDLEKLIGVSYQTISKWENEESLPNIVKLVKCAEIFHVPLFEIYYGKKFVENDNTEKKIKNNKFLFIIISIVSLCALLISLLTIFLNNQKGDNKNSSQFINSQSLVVNNSNVINLRFNDKTVVYDGEEHSIYLEGTIPENYSVEYINNNHINVGIYEITAKVSLNNKLYKEYKATLIINKAPLGVKFNNKTFSYDGNVHSLEIEGNLPKGVSVEYINNMHKTVGEYEVIAKFFDSTGNYDVEDNLIAKLTIVKDGKYHDVYFCYQNGNVEEMVIPDGSTIPNIPELENIGGYSEKWVVEGSNQIVDENYKVTSDVTIVSEYVPNTYKVIYKYNGEVLFERKATYNEQYTFESYELSGDDKLLYWSMDNEKIIPNTTITFTYLHDIVLEANIGKSTSDYIVNVVEGTGVILYGFNDEESVKNTIEYLEIPEIVYVNGKSYRITEISSEAFKDFIKLKKVTIPEGVTTIGSGSFQGCINLEEVILPQSLISIHNYSFKDCYSLKKVHIPSIEKWTDIIINDPIGIFDYGAGLYVDNILQEEVTINTEYINMNCFRNYQHLKNIVLLDNVKRIHESAFRGCVNLTSVKMGENVEVLSSAVFYDCTSLKELSISSNISSIGEKSFANCIALEKIIIKDLNNWLGISINHKDDNPLYYGADLYINNEKITDLEIPEGVTFVGDYLFNNCQAIETIELPNSLMIIGKESFANMKNLRTIVIKENIDLIKDSAFKGCENLEIYVEREKGYSGYVENWNESVKATYYLGEWEYVDGIPIKK